MEVAGVGGHGGGDGAGYLGHRRFPYTGPAGAGAGGTGTRGAYGPLQQLRQPLRGRGRGRGHGGLFSGAGHENPFQPQKPEGPGTGILRGLHGRSPLRPGGRMVHELLAEGRDIQRRTGTPGPLPHSWRPVPHRSGNRGTGPVELRHPGTARDRRLRRGAAGGSALL